jgi:hypothetical protein
MTRRAQDSTPDTARRFGLHVVITDSGPPAPTRRPGRSIRGPPANYIGHKPPGAHQGVQRASASAAALKCQRPGTTSFSPTHGQHRPLERFVQGRQEGSIIRVDRRRLGRQVENRIPKVFSSATLSSTAVGCVGGFQESHASSRELPRLGEIGP